MWSTNGHVYALVTPPQPISWTAARDQALTLGGHLATLTSAEENAFVFTTVVGSFARSGQAGVWLGGYQDPLDAAPADSWHWVTNEPWSYTSWAFGAPDDKLGILPEYYLAYFYFVVPTPTWHDEAPNGGATSFVVEFE